MVNYSQLRNMDLPKLTSAGKTSGKLSKGLVSRAGQVRSSAAIPGNIWAAPDADAASSLIGVQQSPLYDAADAFGTGQAALEELVDQLQVAQDRLDDAHDLVAGTDVVIKSDGTVATPTVGDPAQAAMNESLAQQASSLITSAVKMANAADDIASARIKAAGIDVDPKAIPDGDDDTPKDVNQWWKSLSEAQRRAYLKEHPELIGNLDGIPSDARHKANMETLREDARNGEDKQAARDLLKRINESQDGPADERMLLLGYEPPSDGDDAKVIAAVGNPDNADHTAVYVPGTGTDLGNVGSDIGNAERLREASAEAAPGEKVSTIMWLGYDAPDGYGGAAMPNAAEDGAEDLREFTRGLDATNGSAHTTVVGHSYGSTVVGTADALGGQGTDDGLVTDDVIALGSPGMGYESPGRQGFLDGPQVEHASDMHTSNDHIWGGASASDHISYLQVHGGSPENWSFGGQRFETDGAGGHSEYFDKGTASLENQARIVTEQYDEVDRADRRPK